MAARIGLAAWNLVHPGFAQWTYGVILEVPTKDDVLDDITLCWLTNSGASSARLYWENGARRRACRGRQKTTRSLPVAITVFRRMSIAPEHGRGAPIAT
jgi:hypothetical protein